MARLQADLRVWLASVLAGLASVSAAPAATMIEDADSLCRGLAEASDAVRIDCAMAQLSTNLDRFKFCPFGLAGGGAAAPSALYLIRDGRTQALPSKVTNMMLKSGDIVRLETSGGGGFGEARLRARELVERDVQACPGLRVAGAVSVLEGRGSDVYGGSGSRVSPVWLRNPLMSAGRYWMRLSRFLATAASWPALPAARFPRLFFITDQAPSVGLSQWMDRRTSGYEHAGYRQGGPAPAGPVGRTAAGTRSGGRGGSAGILPG